MNANNDFEQSARSKAGDAKMQPPPGAWNALDADLDKKHAVLLRKKAIRFKRLSMALMLLLVSFIACFYLLFPDPPGEVAGVLHESQPAVEVSRPEVAREPAPGAEAFHPAKAAVQADARTEPDYVQPSRTRSMATETGTSPNMPQPGLAKNQVLPYSPATHTGKAPGPAGVSPETNHVATTGILVFVPEVVSPPVLAAPDPAELPQSNPDMQAAPVLSPGDSVRSGTTRDEDNPLKRGGPFTLALSFSPEVSWYRLKDNTPDQFDDVAMYQGRENPGFSFSAGLTLGYDLNDAWSLGSGIRYSAFAKSMAMPTMVATVNPQNEMHFMYPTSSGMLEMPFDDSYPVLQAGDSLHVRAQCRQLLKFINIPLLLQYRLSSGKWTWHVDGGLALNFIVEDRATIRTDRDETTLVNRTHGLRRSNAGFIISAGIQYRLFNDLSVFTAPAFRGSFTSITHNTAVLSFPYSFGLDTGLLFRF